MKENLFKYFRRNFKKMFEDITSDDTNKFKAQIPNMLTVIRGILTPLLVIISIILHSILMTFIVILIAALTDAFDGFYARKNGYVSEFGALLDAICDKIFTFCIILPIIPISFNVFIIILIIELIISIINSYSKISGKKCKTILLGKIKTIILYLSLIICYLSFIVLIPIYIINFLLIFVIILQILTCLNYFIILIKQINVERMVKK